MVFLDSRAGTEELGLMLKTHGVNVFVTHSSLSQEERHRTEKAFCPRKRLRHRGDKRFRTRH